MEFVLDPILSMLDAIYKQRSDVGEDVLTISSDPFTRAQLDKSNMELIDRCRLFCFMPDRFNFWE